MEEKDLELYKKQRTSFQKSLIDTLKDSLENEMTDWNNLPSIKKSIYRHRYDAIINDITKKIKEEIVKLRTLKKTQPNEIITQDIENIIASKSAIPTSKNPYEWVTKFRNNFFALDCFARMTLFGRLDCKDCWGYDIIEEVTNFPRPNIEDMEPNDQIKEMMSVVLRLNTKTTSNTYSNNSIEDYENYLDTESGQLSMNI